MSCVFSAEIESIQKYVVTSNKMWTIRAGSYILDKFNKDIKDEFDNNKITGGKLIYSSGGSVKAIFDDEESAEKYGKKITTELKDETEIAYLTWAVEKIKGNNGISVAFEKVEKEIQKKRSEKQKPISIINHPLFINCEICKKYPACEEINREGEKRQYLVCQSCKLKSDKSKNRLDIYNDIDGNRHLFDNFEKLVEDDYLALICSDGNRMGELLIELSKKQDAVELLGNFSKKLDKATASAFKKTVEEVFKDYFKEEKDHFPFMVIVLGGDDMSVVMPAKYAFEFTKAFTENFVQETRNFEDNLPEVTVSTGIAIAKRTFPFSNLFEVAEELQSNAKKLSRWLKKNNGSREYSTVDFEIISESLVKEISERRKHLNFRKYLVTGRPYLIGDGEYPFKFEELLDIAERFKKEKVSNSFIHSLYDIVEKPSTMKIELDIKLRRLFKKHEAINDISGYDKPKNNFEGKECLPILDIAEIYSLIGG
ncbi:hypothetical protein KJ693_10370 [bacterium]|nr:hypothetical protein [bacterium]MBU1615693.1 hypothetical protein [bacterium]